jgi:hypothetical protein
MITAATLNAIAPYGREEESRPNDLTYVITANSATFGTDLVSRSFFVQLQRGLMRPGWKSELLAYIEAHGMGILADVLDILQRHEPFTDVETVTRFPEFEAAVLQPMCADSSEYMDVLKHITEAGDAANADVDTAKQIADELTDGLTANGIDPEGDAVFLQSSVIKVWLRDICRPSVAMQMVRNFAKTGMIPHLQPGLNRWPNSGANRSSGILWAAPDSPGSNYRAHPPARALSHRKGQTIMVTL